MTFWQLAVIACLPALVSALVGLIIAGKIGKVQVTIDGRMTEILKVALRRPQSEENNYRKG
jgi:hypothetical protein